MKRFLKFLLLLSPFAAYTVGVIFCPLVVAYALLGALVIFWLVLAWRVTPYL